MLVAIAASIGNLLQGWDNATIAGNSICESSMYSFFPDVAFDLKKFEI